MTFESLSNSIAITMASLSTSALREHKSSASLGGSIGNTVCGKYTDVALALAAASSLVPSLT